MTQTMYGAKVTAVIDEATGGGFEYPDTFEADVAACFARRLSPEDAAAELVARYTAAAKTVRVRLLHNASIPNARWCEPVGWEPANVIEGFESEDGSWWDDHEEIAGLVWLGHPNEYGANEVMEANLSDLRVASCGDCRVIGDVKLS